MRRQTATATRTGWGTYDVRFGKVVRLGVPYRFLLALVAGGWRVRIDQTVYRPVGERRKISLPG